MPNHIHLEIKDENKELSQIIHSIAISLPFISIENIEERDIYLKIWIYPSKSSKSEHLSDEVIQMEQLL